MGVESYLVLWVFTDECCHPNRFRVELMLIENFEIGRLDFPNRDTLESTHCLLPNAAPQPLHASRVQHGIMRSSRSWLEMLVGNHYRDLHPKNWESRIDDNR